MSTQEVFQTQQDLLILDLLEDPSYLRSLIKNYFSIASRDSFNRAAFNNNRKELPVFRAVFLDIDATMFPSYWSLMALKHFSVAAAEAEENKIKNSHLAHRNVATPKTPDPKADAYKRVGLPEEAFPYFRNLLLYIKDNKLFQDLLHHPEKTLKDIEAKLFDSDVHYRDRDVQDCIRKSFEPFFGLKKFLHTAREMGTPVYLYTNTGPADAVYRLEHGGIEPDTITKIISKGTNNVPQNSPYFDKVSTYKACKPNPEPIEAVVKELGLTYKDVIFIGDHVKDLCCCAPLGVPFALHVTGSVHASKCNGMNKLLRDDPDLGMAEFVNGGKLKDIIALRHGFNTLNMRIGKEFQLASPSNGVATIAPFPPNRRRKLSPIYRQVRGRHFT